MGLITLMTENLRRQGDCFLIAANLGKLVSEGKLAYKPLGALSSYPHSVALQSLHISGK